MCAYALIIEVNPYLAMIFRNINCPIWMFNYISSNHSSFTNKCKKNSWIALLLSEIFRTLLYKKQKDKLENNNYMYMY